MVTMKHQSDLLSVICSGCAEVDIIDVISGKKTRFQQRQLKSFGQFIIVRIANIDSIHKVIVSGFGMTIQYVRGADGIIFASDCANIIL